MTVQQQVANRIINMSDEGARFIGQVIDNMNPVFFTVKNPSIEDQPQSEIDTSKRIGIAKGLLGNTDNFDKWNDEIAELFEGKTE